MESEGITSENVPREAVEDIMTSNAVLRRVGSLAELRAVPSSVPGNVYSRYLQGISAGWYSTVQYLGTETCARDVAYSVVSIRTNTCFSNGDVKGIPTSIYISCTTASSSITTYTASNACEGPAVTVTEPLKCYDREGEIATDDYFHGDTSYLTTCAIGSEPNIPGTYAGTMYYDDSNCKRMLSFSGYVNDVCFKTGLTSSVEYNYPNKTNYLTSSTCKGTQKIFPNLFVTSQCVANPAANNDDLYGSNFYKSGLVNGDWTNPPKFPDSAGSGTPMAMNSVSIAVITVLGIVILGLVGGIAALCMYRNKLLYRGLSGGFDMSDDNELNFMDIHIEQTLDNRNPAMEM